jgi:hypothetical protein
VWLKDLQAVQRLPQGARWTQELKGRLKQLPSLSRLLGTEAFRTCKATQMLIKRVPGDQSVQNVQPDSTSALRRTRNYAPFASRGFI